MAKRLLVLCVAVLLSKASAEKEERKLAASDFNVVRCSANRSFYFQHRTVECINAEGQTSCDHLGLFMANKLRCYKCCSIVINSTKSSRNSTLSIGTKTPITIAVTSTASPTQTATPIPRVYSTPKSGKKGSNTLHVFLITIGSSVTVLVAIGATLSHCLWKRRRHRPVISQEEHVNMVERKENENGCREYAGLAGTSGVDALQEKLYTST